MAENKKYNSILVSGRKDETLTYSRYIKDEETGKSVKESLDGKVNITDKIDIDQIAQADWDKLKDEYLRLDGGNSMKNALDMDGNSIVKVNNIESNSSSPVFINLRDNEVIIGANDDEDQGVSVPQWVTIWRDSSFYGNAEAAGFKTHDRSKLGLLNNNGGVAKPLNSGEIQQCFLVAFG